MATPLNVPVKINNRSIIISYYGSTGKKWSSFASAYDQSTLESLTSLFSVSGSVVTYDSKTLKYNDVDVVPSDTIVDDGEYVALPEPQDPIETSIKIGTKSLIDASVGTTKLFKAYIGNHLIFERLGSNFLTSDGNLLQTQDGNVFNAYEISGFNITLDGAGHSETWAGDLYGYAKFNYPPNDQNDFDVQWGCGIGEHNTKITTDNWATSSVTKSFTDVIKIYCWATSGGGTNCVKINNVDISSNLYNNAYELNVTQDSTFMVQGAWGD